jgi:hypothetical protein
LGYCCGVPVFGELMKCFFNGHLKYSTHNKWVVYQQKRYSITHRK